MPSSFNQGVIDQFRRNFGKVGPPFEGTELVLLTTTGARTGTRHTTPLVCLREGDRLFVFASYAGAEQHPQWYRNLLTDPSITVETGTDRYEAKAVDLPEPERGRVFDAAVTGPHPGFGDYQRKTSRVIPVVELVRA